MLLMRNKFNELLRAYCLFLELQLLLLVVGEQIDDPTEGPEWKGDWI